METYSKPPNAQPNLPLVGALPGMARNLSGFLQTNYVTHGDIYTIHMARRKFVMLHHPRHVEHVKIRHKKVYHTGKGSPVTSLLFPNGILTTDGQRWRERRKPLQPYFNPPYLKSKFSLMSASIEKGLNLLEEAANTNEGCDLKTVTSYLSMRALTETIFGVEAQPEEMVEIKSALDFVITDTLKFVAQGSLPDWIPVPGRKKSQHVMQTFRDVAKKLVAHQQELAIEEDSLLGTLQNVSLSDQEQSSDRIVSQILELLLAGYETTSSTLFWVITFLIAHEDVCAKVTQEIDRKFGTDPPNEDNFIQLPYLKMVLSEVLRLFPTAYLFWLRCMEDDVIDGYQISEGETAVLSAYHVHRHPEFWDEPEAFKPERFAPDNAKKIPKSAFIPFGLGARKCLGNQFALMEIQVAIIRILQQYKLDFMPGYRVPEPLLGVSIRPNRGVMISTSRRE